jgi:uncharacterized repeat protein (TIGR01451 family)
LPAAAAPLPPGTVLTIDPGVNDDTTNACYTGSCFKVAYPSYFYVFHYNLSPGSDGGIVVGKSQARGTSPAPGELAGFVRVGAVEAPGSLYTTPYSSGGPDASANIFDDRPCNSASACAGKTVLGTLNRAGGIGAVSNLGSAESQCTSSYYCPGVTKWTITQAGAPGIDGDRYVLEYQRRHLDSLDGIEQIYTFHLEGTIQLPKTLGVDASVTLAAAPNPATQYQALTYTATVTNSGSDSASGVSLSDSLPTGVDFVSAAASQGFCNGTAVISCSLGDLASGTSATVQITVTPTVSGTLNNTVNVASNELDVNPVNNSANSSVSVLTPAITTDVAVAMTASHGTARRYENVTYTVNISNIGPNNASNVTLTDTVPSGFRLVSASSAQGNCYGTSTVTCLFNTLASGASATATIVMQARARGTYTNVAEVTTTTRDSNSANNRASVTTIVK